VFGTGFYPTEGGGWRCVFWYLNRNTVGCPRCMESGSNALWVPGISLFRYVNSWQYVLSRIWLIVDVSLCFLSCSVSAREMKCDVNVRVSVETIWRSHHFCISLSAFTALPVFSFCSQVRNWWSSFNVVLCSSVRHGAASVDYPVLTAKQASSPAAQGSALPFF